MEAAADQVLSLVATGMGFGRPTRQFCLHPVVDGLEGCVLSAIVARGSRIHVGTHDGCIIMYHWCHIPPEDGYPRHCESRPLSELQVSDKPISQLHIWPDRDLLLALTNGVVHAFDALTLAPLFRLGRPNEFRCFAMEQQSASDRLVLGARRRLQIFSIEKEPRLLHTLSVPEAPAAIVWTRSHLVVALESASTPTNHSSMLFRISPTSWSDCQPLDLPPGCTAKRSSLCLLPDGRVLLEGDGFGVFCSLDTGLLSEPKLSWSSAPSRVFLLYPYLLCTTPLGIDIFPLDKGLVTETLHVLGATSVHADSHRAFLATRQRVLLLIPSHPDERTDVLDPSASSRAGAGATADPAWATESQEAPWAAAIAAATDASARSTLFSGHPIFAVPLDHLTVDRQPRKFRTSTPPMPRVPVATDSSHYIKESIRIFTQRIWTTIKDSYAEYREVPPICLGALDALHFEKDADDDDLAGLGGLAFDAQFLDAPRAHRQPFDSAPLAFLLFQTQFHSATTQPLADDTTIGSPLADPVLAGVDESPFGAFSPSPVRRSSSPREPETPLGAGRPPADADIKTPSFDARAPPPGLAVTPIRRSSLKPFGEPSGPALEGVRAPSLILECFSASAPNLVDNDIVCSAFLFDTMRAVRVSEEFWFSACDWDLIDDSQAMAVFTCARHALFSVPDRIPEIVLVFFVMHGTTPEAEAPPGPTSSSSAPGGALLAPKVAFPSSDTAAFPLRRMLAVAHIKLFNDRGDFVPPRSDTIPATALCPDPIDDKALAKMLLSGRKRSAAKVLLSLAVTELDESDFPSHLRRVDPSFNSVAVDPFSVQANRFFSDTADTPAVLREIQEFGFRRLHAPTEPVASYLNSLYIYPQAADLRSLDALGPGESLLFSVELRSLGSDNCQPCIYGRVGEPAFVPKYLSNIVRGRHPFFGDEVKIDLPVQLSSTHHALFRFLVLRRGELYSVAYAVFPVVSNGCVVGTKHHSIPVFSGAPPDNYLERLPGAACLESGARLFSLDTVLVSSIYGSDPYISAWISQHLVARHRPPRSSSPSSLAGSPVLGISPASTGSPLLDAQSLPQSLIGISPETVRRVLADARRAAADDDLHERRLALFDAVLNLKLAKGCHLIERLPVVLSLLISNSVDPQQPFPEMTFLSFQTLLALVCAVSNEVDLEVASGSARQRYKSDATPADESMLSARPRPPSASPMTAADAAEIHIQSPTPPPPANDGTGSTTGSNNGDERDAANTSAASSTGITKRALSFEAGLDDAAAGKSSVENVLLSPSLSMGDFQSFVPPPSATPMPEGPPPRNYDGNAVLVSYVVYVFDYVQIGGALCYTSLCSLWLELLDTLEGRDALLGLSVEDVLQTAWFLFALISKSMALHCCEHLAKQRDAGAAQFLSQQVEPTFFPASLVSDICSLLSRLASYLSQDIYLMERAWALNTHMTLFVRDLFSMMHPQQVFTVVRHFWDEIHHIPRFRLSFLQMVLDSEYYVAMNDPLEEPNNGFRGHILCGLLIDEVRRALDETDEALREHVLMLVQRLFAKHSFDQRYQSPEARKALASMYVPLLDMLVVEWPQICRISGHQFQRYVLSCIVWILRDLDGDLLCRWFAALSSHVQGTFVHLVAFACDVFRVEAEDDDYDDEDDDYVMGADRDAPDDPVAGDDGDGGPAASGAGDGSDSGDDDEATRSSRSSARQRQQQQQQQQQLGANARTGTDPSEISVRTRASGSSGGRFGGRKQQQQQQQQQQRAAKGGPATSPDEEDEDDLAWRLQLEAHVGGAMARVLYDLAAATDPEEGTPVAVTVLGAVFGLLKKDPADTVVCLLLDCLRVLLDRINYGDWLNPQSQNAHVQMVGELAHELVRHCNFKSDGVRSRSAALMYLLTRNAVRAGISMGQIVGDALLVGLLHLVFVAMQRDFRLLGVSVSGALAHATNSAGPDASVLVKIFERLLQPIGPITQLMQAWDREDDVNRITEEYHQFALHCESKYPRLKLDWLARTVMSRHYETMNAELPATMSEKPFFFQGNIIQREAEGYVELFRLGFQLTLRDEFGGGVSGGAASVDSPGTEASVAAAAAAAANGVLSPPPSRTKGGAATVDPAATPDAAIVAANTTKSLRTTPGSPAVMHSPAAQRLRERTQSRSRSLSFSAGLPTNSKGRQALLEGTRDLEQAWAPIPLEEVDYVYTQKFFGVTSAGTRFQFKNYAPSVFRALRECFGYHEQQYLLSLCGKDCLRLFVNNGGRSGSSIYLSRNDHFIVKTIPREEYLLLKSMLPHYFAHVTQHRNTLLTRFLGLHSFKLYPGRRVYSVVMENLLITDKPIHARFDLKGSKVNRTARSKGGSDADKPEASTTLKDQDLQERFHLGPKRKEQLLTQLNTDCEFLAKFQIMDYSLLVGIHKGGDAGGRQMGGAINPAPLISPVYKEASFVSLFKRDGGGVASDRDDGSVYFFGVVDLLQRYNLRKQLETSLKGLLYEKRELSSIEPGFYKDRFLAYVISVLD